MSSSPRLEVRGVRRSFGATKALRGVELTVAPGAFWSAVASEARHRFWTGASESSNMSHHAKAPSPRRSAGAVQTARQKLLKAAGSYG